MVKRYVLLFFFVLTIPLIFAYAEDGVVLKLDKNAYKGVSDHMKVTLTSSVHNKNQRVAEQVYARVNATDNDFGINFLLVETGVNTGIFTSDVNFSFNTNNDVYRTIKVRNGATINVQCAGQTASAIWKTYDAAIKFNSQKYSGLGAVPEIVLTDYDLNTKPNDMEEVQIVVTSSSDAKGIPIKLKEEKVDSGIFKGSFTLSSGTSNSKEGVLHVEYNDKLETTFIDTTNSHSSSEVCTSSALWSPQSATVSLSNNNFIGLNSRCRITVKDNDINIRKDVKDIASIKMISDHDPSGIYVKLYETDKNTGLFSTDIKFSKDESNAERNTLKIGPKSHIKVTYCDDWSAANTMYTLVTAVAEFQFSEGVLTTSTNAQQGLNDSIVIKIKDSDSDVNSQKNTLPIKVTSSSNSQGLTLWLEETGASTGSFIGTLYFSNKEVRDKEKKDVTLIVSPGDEIELAYNDTTIPEGTSSMITKKFTWAYKAAEVTFSKDSYIGYSASTDIIVKDSEANKDPRAVDKVRVKLHSKSMQEFTMLINETSANSGQFKGTIYFGKQGNPSKGIVKVASSDVINLLYEDEGEYSVGTVEATATWRPYDGSLEFDHPEYYENGAEVKITLKDLDIVKKPNEKGSIVVSVGIAGKAGEIKLPLVQTNSRTGTFTGTLSINGTKSKYLNLRLLDGEQLEVKYLDEDTTENTPIERKASAVWKLK